MCLWLISVHVIDTAVEQRKRPELRGKPVAVVQYNPWKGGGLIAVSYEARKCGVLRSVLSLTPVGFCKVDCTV